MTIHKSQGLTFDKVVIDAGRAFTYGQVYVALSRCRTFHGIVLASPITKKIIKTDPIVAEYMATVRRITIDNGQEEEKERHLSAIFGAERTLWMIRDGLTLEQIAEESGQRIEIIYGHLAELIEQGQVEIDKFLSHEKYDAIYKALRKTGIDAPLKEIKALCTKEVKYAEIRMVIADVRRNGFGEEESEWKFVNYVPFTLYSKYFFTCKCRVVLSPKGYYLEVGKEYIKLGDYPTAFNWQQGNVWIKKPLRGSGKTGKMIVHVCNGKSYTVGRIVEGEDKILFFNPQEDLFQITFTDK